MLKKGDIKIDVPAIKDLVALKGQFNYPAEKKPEHLYVPYTEGKDAKYYIYKYGAGFSDSAYRLKTYVIRPNGQVLRTRRSMFGKNYPKVEKGSTIVVPSKEAKIKKDKTRVSSGEAGQRLQKILTATISAISSVLTLYLLFLTVRNTNK
ncbi:MAG: hypothetical protein U0T77_08875 [Chitinophagales bacterium]